MTTAENDKKYCNGCFALKEKSAYCAFVCRSVIEQPFFSYADIKPASVIPVRLKFIVFRACDFSLTVYSVFTSCAACPFRNI